MTALRSMKLSDDSTPIDEINAWFTLYQNSRKKRMQVARE